MVKQESWVKPEKNQIVIMQNKLSPWQLVSKIDVSVSKWFPIEERIYQKPDGNIVNDFTVATLEDVSLVLPVMLDGKIVMVEQFKPGANQLTLEFPGGRLKPGEDFLDGAKTELLEETGMQAEMFIELGKTITFPTKASETIMNYIALNSYVVGQQTLDENEDIAIHFFQSNEIDQMISNGVINTAPSITLWHLAKVKNPKYFE